MNEEFSRIVTDWPADIAALKAVLLAAKAHNDEYLRCEGACDKVSVNPPAVVGGPLGPPPPLGGRNHVPLEDWLDGLTAAGPTDMDVVMGSSHHNAPQWFITCAVENPDTAVTVILMRSIPEARCSETGAVFPPISYQFTEHAVDLHAAVRFIAHLTLLDEGTVTVSAEHVPCGCTLTAEEAGGRAGRPDDSDPVPVDFPHRYGGDYSVLDGFPLPLFLEGRERVATITATLSRTV
jgi:hypothetical protein